MAIVQFLLKLIPYMRGIFSMHTDLFKTPKAYVP